jgi:hypothetical protein
MEISFGTWIIVVFDLYIFLFVFVFGNKPFLCISTLKNDKFFAFTCSLLPFSHKTPLISLTIHTHGASCWRKMTNALTWHRNMIKLHNTENFFLLLVLFIFLFSYYVRTVKMANLSYLFRRSESERAKADFRKVVGELCK